ncbi:hypothetical protein M0534_12075 [Methylonatrum kenyense]|uniref:hypothetical protein n=1 Tax=Methylonatrum kenyense TaxID=455253 RepID=UPI0020BF7D6D|nr:hypothetical protein [Methylonatrum kenyense]MCK8517057.1 hypothetical protein [Methylonatrum kenyense]
MRHHSARIVVPASLLASLMLVACAGTEGGRFAEEARWVNPDVSAEDQRRRYNLDMSRCEPIADRRIMEIDEQRMREAEEEGETDADTAIYEDGERQALRRRALHDCMRERGWQRARD